MTQNDICGKCSTCATGLELYMLDKNEPMCPHIGCYSNGECPFYKKMDITDESINLSYPKP